MKKHPHSHGIVGLIVVLVIALIILGYYGVNVKKIIDSPQVQENLTYAWGIVKTVWGEISDIVVGLYHSLISLIKEMGSSFS